MAACGVQGPAEVNAGLQEQVAEFFESWAVVEGGVIACHGEDAIDKLHIAAGNEVSFGFCRKGSGG